MENSKEEKKEWNFENYHPHAFHIHPCTSPTFFVRQDDFVIGEKKNHIRKTTKKQKELRTTTTKKNWQTFTNIITLITTASNRTHSLVSFNI